MKHFQYIFIKCLRIRVLCLLHVLLDINNMILLKRITYKGNVMNILEKFAHTVCKHKTNSKLYSEQIQTNIQLESLKIIKLIK